MGKNITSKELAVFKKVLQKLRAYLNSPFWQGAGSVLDLFPRGQGRRTYKDIRKEFEQYRRKAKTEIKRKQGK